MMKNLIIIGARGFGREVYNFAIESIGYNSDFVIKGFLDDKSDALNGYSNYPVILDSVENYQIITNDVFICALGEVKYKKYYSEIILAKGGEFISLIHKDAYIAMNSTIGKGCIICPTSRIHCDVRVGNFVTLQPFSVLGHDVTIGDWCHINDYTDCGGGTKIGNEVTLHTRSFILPKAIVEDRAMVGAGSIVLRLVKSGTTVFGAPAKPLPLPKSNK